METLSLLAGGFALAFTAQNLMLALIGCFIGTIVGALPGLGPSNGVAILIPIAFSLGLGPIPSLILLCSVYYGALYGSRISAILLNIPGDDAAMMTCLDGHPMAQKGMPGQALTLSAIASFVGAFIATWGLVFLAPQLVKIALLFGPAEYFVLYVMAFATLGGIMSNNQGKALFAVAVGLAIAMVGSDSQTGSQRFTFGQIYLFDGVSFLVAVVGLFALSEVFYFLEQHSTGAKTEAKKMKIGKLLPSWSMVKSTIPTMGRTTVIGFICGVLPGSGATLGSFLSYSLEKATVDRDGKSFGTGDPRGVVAPEVGNNAAAGGSLVPMLSLGIPGSGTTAILLALLLQLNITPGPLLFSKNPDIVWSLIASLFIANVMLLVMNVPLVGIFTRVLLVPTRIMMPIVAMISVVGVYSLSGSTVDVMTMVGFGLLGWLFRKLDVPIVPIILGILLGNEMEVNLRRAMTISDGEWSILVGSPLAIILWAIAITGFLLPVILGRRVKKRMAAELNETNAASDK